MSRWPTNLKIFALIALALAPLGTIALVASLVANRQTNLQRRADMRATVILVQRQLYKEFSADATTLRDAAEEVRSGATTGNVCAHLRDDLEGGTNGQRLQYAFFAPGGSNHPTCASAGFSPARPRLHNRSNGTAVALGQADLDLDIGAPGRMATGVVRYSAARLRTIALASTSTRPDFKIAITLRLGDRALSLMPQASLPVSLGRESFSELVGVDNLIVDLSIAAEPPDAITLLLTFLPLLMWGSAALIGFLVIDRLLIRPLGSLRSAVASYRADSGRSFPIIRTPAREIRELGHAFADTIDRIAAHEAELAVALSEQTKLTREVHHRVKNNLQLISSLVNLHARDAQDEGAVSAFATIQRRVEALAIVHRNHFAATEASGGILVKQLLNELSVNLRGSHGFAAEPRVIVSPPNLMLDQDTAIPVAFLITELVEIAAMIDGARPITIKAEICAGGSACRLTVSSRAFAERDEVQTIMASNFGRVIEGLRRQLRSPLDIDAAVGSFAITVPVAD